MCISLHAIASTGSNVFDEAKAQRTSSIVIALEFRNGCLCSRNAVEANYARSSRSSARFVLNLGLVHFSNSGEKLYQILVTGGPG